jgi:succinate dehydrogenase / fumarate reductase, cytochrome b subunit
MSSSTYILSTIGKKQMMAITGLAWCGFVTAHMLGNLLYLVSAEAYNAYGHSITSGNLYYAIEAGLAATLLGHMFFALLVVLGNRAARPVGYAVSPQGKSKTSATMASRTMAYSGALVLVFIVLHLITFRFGTYYEGTAHGVPVRDLSRLMHEVFSSPGYVAWYVIALAVLAGHLSHALWSSLQTLGFIPGGKEATIRQLSYAFGIFVSLGFALNPLYIFFFQRGAQ